LAAVWNRTRSKALELAEQTGATLAASPAELAAQCDADVSALFRIKKSLFNA
jgi:3-hydroxyisobutyrate dehydrogenase-like beta-hydroxyacid dehydrogenase